MGFKRFSLCNWQVKEEAFRKQAAGSVDFLRRQRSYPDGGSPDMLDVPFEILEHLTGLRFSSAQEWIDWFEAHHERLRLSPDGERLIVAPQ